MRPPTACTACRKRRRKCNWKAPNEACSYCKLKKIACSLVDDSEVVRHDESQSPSTTLNGFNDLEAVPAPGWTTTTSLALPPTDVCLDVARLYFRYIHDTQLSLFHRPTFLQELAVGSVPMVILMAILSLGARFSDDAYFAGTDARVRGRPYAREAQRLLDVSDVTLSTMRACLLLGGFFGAEGEAMRENVYYTIACRMGLLLDVPDTQALDPLQNELNVRLWWALVMADVWSCNGVQLPRLLPIRDNIPFPGEEEAFLSMRHQTSNEIPSVIGATGGFGASLLAQMIKLNTILIEISEMNQSAANQPLSFTFDNTVETLMKRLDLWYAALPVRLRDTQENMDYFAQQGLGGTFVAIYLGYYHYGQLLFYQYLHRNIHDGDDVSSKTGYYADKCKAHSMSLCEIVYRAFKTPGAEVLYNMVGHVLAIASTVQLHTLLFSSDDFQVRHARRRLEHNFEILSQLQRLWPALDHSFERFQEFHRACQRSKESSFRMDKWMLKFLFENSKPIYEKPDDDVILPDIHMWSMQDLGFSPFDAMT